MAPTQSRIQLNSTPSKGKNAPAAPTLPNLVPIQELIEQYVKRHRSTKPHAVEVIMSESPKIKNILQKRTDMMAMFENDPIDWSRTNPESYKGMGTYIGYALVLHRRQDGRSRLVLGISHEIFQTVLAPRGKQKEWHGSFHTSGSIYHIHFRLLTVANTDNPYFKTTIATKQGHIYLTMIHNKFEVSSDMVLILMAMIAALPEKGGQNAVEARSSRQRDYFKSFLQNSADTRARNEKTRADATAAAEVREAKREARVLSKIDPSTSAASATSTTEDSLANEGDIEEYASYLRDDDVDEEDFNESEVFPSHGPSDLPQEYKSDMAA